MAKTNSKSGKIADVEEVYNREKAYVQPLSNTYDDAIFDALEADTQDSTLSIMSIIPDHTQPRRILPAEIRPLWDGTPRGYGAVIDAWESRVQKIAKGASPVDILTGKASALDRKSDDPLVLNFTELLGFAANIRDIGLNHPIGVVKRGDYNRIVYGERRYTAYQFLNHYLGNKEDWSNIKAKTLVASDWEIAKAQSSENFQNKKPNAIGIARQFAKLLMIARTDGGERYDSWNQLVNPGGCDRAWYAQVANGELHAIPRGMGPQFEQALNITVGQMRQYRKLLRLTDDHKINDALWLMGDAGNWAEQFMREVTQYLDVSKISEVLNLSDDHTVTIVTVSQSEAELRKAVINAKEAAKIAEKVAEEADTEPENDEIPETRGGAANRWQPFGIPTPALPASGEDDTFAWESQSWVGKDAYTGPLSAPVKVHVTEALSRKIVRAKTETGEVFELSYASLRPYDAASHSETPTTDDQWLGKAVRSKTVQHIGIVTSDDGGDIVRVKFAVGYSANMFRVALERVDYQLWLDANTPTTLSSNTPPADSPQNNMLPNVEVGVVAETPVPSASAPDDTFAQTNPQLVLRALADVCAMLELPETSTIEAFAQQDRAGMQTIVAESGLEAMEREAEIYRVNLAYALEKIMQFGEQRIEALKAKR